MLELRPVIIYDFSKLNLKSTVLSKRKLKWFVEEGHVEGWNDPRFPTVQGIMRRGMTVAALSSFMLEQGASKNTNMMEWAKSGPSTNKSWTLWCRATPQLPKGLPLSSPSRMDPPRLRLARSLYTPKTNL